MNKIKRTFLPFVPEKQIIGYVLSPVELSGGKIELTRIGEELYRKKQLAVGSLLLVEDENAKHVILTTNARETNVLFEERSVYQALRKEGRVEKKLEGVDVGQVIMEFSLVGEVYEEGEVSRLDRPSRPPSPGSEVYQLSKEDRDVLFKGYVMDVLDKRLKEEYDYLKGAFKFGRVIGSRDLDGLILRPKINMHLGIVGTTGSGKSFTAGALIEGIARYARKISEYKDVITSVIVFDVHGDYVSTYGDKDREVDKYETRGMFWDDIVIVSLKPSALRESLVLGIDFVYEEGEQARRIVPLYTPSELVSIVRLLYGASGGGAYRSLIERLFEYEEDEESLLTVLHDLAKGDINVEEARYEIERLVDFAKDSQVEFTTNTKRAAKRALLSFLNRIREFLRYPTEEDNIVGPKQLIEYARRNTLVIIDLSGSGAKGVDNTIKDIAISYVMRVLYNELADEFRNTDNRLIFLIDEAQTFIPAKDYDTGAVLTKKIVRTIASQGRKFGFSLVLISQRPAFMDPHAFSLVNSLIVHRTAIGDAERLAKLFGLPRSIAEVFSNQRTGEAFVFGQMFGLPMRIKVRKGIDKKLI